MARLSDDEIDRIAEAVTDRVLGHPCRFSGISESELQATVKLANNVEKVLSESGSVVRKFILTLLLIGISSVVGTGFVSWLKSLKDVVPK